MKSYVIPLIVGLVFFAGLGISVANSYIHPPPKPPTNKCSYYFWAIGNLVSPITGPKIQNATLTADPPILITMPTVLAFANQASRNGANLVFFSQTNSTTGLYFYTHDSAVIAVDCKI